MFKVPPSIAAERLTICSKCKHYKPETHSCGTFLFGNKLSPEDLAEAEASNEITHYRKKLRLWLQDACKNQIRAGTLPDKQVGAVQTQ